MVWTGVAGSPYYSNFYFGPASAEYDPALAHDAVADAMNLLGPAFTADLTATVESEVLLIESQTGDAVGSAPAGTVSYTGESTNPLLPASTQALLRLSTGAFVNGRRIQGRVNIPGMVTGGATEGLPNDFIKETILDAFTPMLTVTPEIPWVVWSKKNGTLHPVRELSVWDQFAVLRSRRD